MPLGDRTNSYDKHGHICSRGLRYSNTVEKELSEAHSPSAGVLKEALAMISPGCFSNYSCIGERSVSSVSKITWFWVVKA